MTTCLELWPARVGCLHHPGRRTAVSSVRLPSPGDWPGRVSRNWLSRQATMAPRLDARRHLSARRRAGRTGDDHQRAAIAPAAAGAEAAGPLRGSLGGPGEDLGHEADDVHGRIGFEWLSGGFFLQQRVDLQLVGYRVEGLELIGYDPATGTYPSTGLHQHARDADPLPLGAGRRRADHHHRHAGGQVAAAGHRPAAAAAVPALARVRGRHRGDRSAAPDPAATASVLLVVEMVDSPRRPPALVVGAHDSFTILEGAGARSWLGLLLAPLGAYRLLGPPMAELSGQLVDLTEVLGADGRRLGERLREASTWRHRFALLDSFLLRRLDGGSRPAPEVAWAWRRLVATGGRVPIGQLADEVGWSHRHLIARFRQQVGLRPKTAARLIRFDGVLRRLDQGRPLDWGLVAREAGYADQAHLIRDFHQFSGTTPTAFVAQTIRPGGDGERQVNFVQDTLADAS
jgi:AraC-like DNA-binding protein